MEVKCAYLKFENGCGGRYRCTNSKSISFASVKCGDYKTAIKRCKFYKPKELPNATLKYKQAVSQAKKYIRKGSAKEKIA